MYLDGPERLDVKEYEAPESDPGVVLTEVVRLLRDGGRYLEMGNVNPGQSTEFAPDRLTRKGIDVTSVVRYQPWYLLKALTGRRSSRRRAYRSSSSS